jgi:hypothetical protein
MSAEFVNYGTDGIIWQGTFDLQRSTGDRLTCTAAHLIPIIEYPIVTVYWHHSIRAYIANVTTLISCSTNISIPSRFTAIMTTKATPKVLFALPFFLSVCRVSTYLYGRHPLGCHLAQVFLPFSVRLFPPLSSASSVTDCSVAARVI